MGSLRRAEFAEGASCHSHIISTHQHRHQLKNADARSALPMLLSTIEPSDKDDCDERTFECWTCAYAETVTVKFR
jgi:hypothetical protein